jgi:hypothetical protein
MQHAAHGVTAHAEIRPPLDTGAGAERARRFSVCALGRPAATDSSVSAEEIRETLSATRDWP